MSTEQKTTRVSGPLSARSGFFLGIGTAAIVGALAIVAVRYDGTAKATVVPPPEPAAAAAPASLPIAEHIAAMNAAAETASAPPTAESSSKPMPAVLLSGTIALDPTVTSVSGPVTVFVIARDKAGKGHPILAKRLDITSFPAKFTLGAGDSMMGGTPPDTVSLEARIDLDRDAMTKEPNAPATKIDTVKLGASDVTLTLK